MGEREREKEGGIGRDREGQGGTRRDKEAQGGTERGRRGRRYLIRPAFVDGLLLLASSSAFFCATCSAIVLFTAVLIFATRSLQLISVYFWHSHLLFPLFSPLPPSPLSSLSSLSPPSLLVSPLVPKVLSCFRGVASHVLVVAADLPPLSRSSRHLT